MPNPLSDRILSHIKSERYQPQRPRKLARQLQLHGDESYPTFREALRDLMREGRVAFGASGTVMLPTQRVSREGEIIGTYRHNRRGFGFVVPTDPKSHEDLFIPEGENGGAMTGDIVRARITSRGMKEGRALYTGRISEILKRTNQRFPGTLVKSGGKWIVLPDGNALTEPILTPDAASRHIKPGTKVVVELTIYPRAGVQPQGVITEVLGAPGQKDVDRRAVVVQFNLPDEFPDEALEQARAAVAKYNQPGTYGDRFDLSGETIVTIDPDDAKDYDDAISLRQVEGGYWQLGVHIADVSHFIPPESPLDLEAKDRGNSTYFPGFVIPMLPEILSNGICSLQEGVPRLCKSVFITFDDHAHPVGTKFANTIIRSAKRLRYTEAQAIIDHAQQIPHPDGPKRVHDYPEEVVELLEQMNVLAKRIQKRRLAAGQLVLDLPDVDLVLDEEGKVVDAVPEDQSFTHTLIEMFMVEANEAVARLLDSLNVPFLRRTHPEPDLEASERLRQFVNVAGYKLPKHLDRKGLQTLLETVRGRPEAFAINLAILKSLTRAEYSPESIGHYALASEHYSHFTSPIRRYADLTIHRLLGEYVAERDIAEAARTKKGRKKIQLDNAPSYDALVEMGRHLSFTERRSEDAERELRQVKLLTLLQNHIGEEFTGVVTGITNFGLFIQLQSYLIDGLIRYENLLDDWWDVDDRSGTVRGQRSGTRIGIGDVVKVIIVRVDIARRELDLSVSQLLGRGAAPAPGKKEKPRKAQQEKRKKMEPRGGENRRGRRVSTRRTGPRRR